ncbi:ATP-binding protein [Sorangium sp. So ce590]|uniref:ATP-binding protein n=1 Tax=Sorangium sp. So ce590 TaxID=3133317 RepID=UPI003F5E2B04
MTHATRSKMSPAELCLELATLDKRERDQRNLAARAKDATLGPVKPLDRFDWSHPRQIDRELFEERHETLGFIARGDNVLLRGQAGVGKSTLAKHLGFAALAKGHTARITTLSAALADLLRHETLPAIERRLRRYTGPDLLILDELGYVHCDASAADLLFRIVSKRHESRAVVITTKSSHKQWGTVFGDAPCLGALIDRFAQHCHVLDIDADSWRDEERLEKKGRAPRPRR